MGEQPNSTPPDTGLLNGDNNESNGDDGKVTLKNVLENSDKVPTPADVESVPEMGLAIENVLKSACEISANIAKTVESLPSLENEALLKNSIDTFEATKTDVEYSNKEVSNNLKSPQIQENGLSADTLESNSEPATELHNGSVPKISIVPELAKMMPSLNSMAVLKQDNGPIEANVNVDASAVSATIDCTDKKVAPDSDKENDRIKQDLDGDEVQPKDCEELENDFVSVEPQMANLEQDVMAASFNNDPFADITDNHLCENADATMSSMASDGHDKIDESVIHSLSDTDEESDEGLSDGSSRDNEDEIENSDFEGNLSSSSVSIIEEKNEPIAVSDDSSVEEPSNGKRNRNGEDVRSEPIVKKAKAMTVDSDIEEISSDEDVILIEDSTSKNPLNNTLRKDKRLVVSKRKSVRDSWSLSTSTTLSSSFSTPSESDGDCGAQIESSKSPSSRKPLSKYKKKSKRRRKPEQSIGLPKSSEDPLYKTSSSFMSDIQANYATLRTTINRIPAESTTKALPHESAINRVPLLPELTDDMFVREVPSFVVPYIYEKPSSTKLRETVSKMKQQLEELKLKLSESLKSEETPVESVKPEPGTAVEEAIVEKKKPVRRSRKKPDSDDSDWGAENNLDSESEETSASDSDGGMRVPRIDFEDDIESIKTHIITPASASAAQHLPNQNDSYFESPLGKFFIEIGNNLVDEHVQTEFLRIQNRSQASKSKQADPGTQMAIEVLVKNLELSKDSNRSFKFPLKKCDFCPFETESLLIMAYHYEKPHFADSTFKCNFCEFSARPAFEILNHLDEFHQIKGRIETLPTNPCPNCSYEDSGKAGKLSRHMVSCMRKYKPDLNLAPVEWDPPAKTFNMKCSLMGIVNSYQAVQRQTSNVELATFKHKVSRPLIASTPSPLVRSSPSLSKTCSPSKIGRQLSDRPSFVVCEICDGYINNAELRNHMQVSHNVKIHQKMSRPPLNCQKCQSRFFTDSGLERHLLGSHGLVTTSMQKAANCGKDAGRCPICGRVFQWKLLSHMSAHNKSLKPAHLSYKCTFCTQTFGTYRKFESHIYSAHANATRKKTSLKSIRKLKPSKLESAQVIDSVVIED